MNQRHLGDALDFWKGGIIGLLDNCLHDLHVVPMFTDRDVPAVWTPARLDLYGRLLGVNVAQICKPQVQFSAETRPIYFQNLGVGDNTDLFVDPDTGIEPPSGHDHRHIRFTEIGQLLRNSTSRVVVIYQHRPQGQGAGNDWLVVLLQRLANRLNGCRPFAYEAGAAALVFVSGQPGRVSDMRQTIQHGLSPEGPELFRIVAPDSKRPSSP